MHLLRLRVERFRGIRNLDWQPRGSLLCLIGPGDSGKSTILDAIRLVTVARTTIELTEADFFERNATAGFTIAATFADFPVAMLHEQAFGRYLGGVDRSGALTDEPGDGEPTLTVRLDVDEDLQPVWTVVTAAQPEGKAISYKQRRALSVGTIGVDLDEPFTWAWQHALARATTETDITALLTEATERIRQAVIDLDLAPLDDVVAATGQVATRLGAGPVSDALGAALDLARVNPSALVLHAGALRASTAGAGTRRVLAIAAELLSMPSGALVCIDEAEVGLEPHRVRRLIGGLRQLTDPGEAAERGQVILTSHSTQVIEEVGVAGLCIVRNTAGDVTVTTPPTELVAAVRGGAAALLARKIIVAEGRTEVGIMRALDEHWAASHDSRTFGHLGVAVVDGGGTNAANRAVELSALGYPTLLFTDSDVDLTVTPSALHSAGVTHVSWPEAMCTEERTITDLSWPGVQALFDQLGDYGIDGTVAVAKMLVTQPGQEALTAFGRDPASAGDTLESLEAIGLSQKQVRTCFWHAAKHSSNTTRGWFKRIDTGEMLGRVIADDADARTAGTGQTLAVIEAWCFDA